MAILVRQLSAPEIGDYQVKSWPVWVKEISEFDWYYDSTEDCLMLEGEVEVSTPDGKVTRIVAGDYVTFPQGLSCRWKVIKPVRKHYRFR
ncbi:MAG: cupin domain-containing protein [Candidatus Cloacimonetes bacterium]|nr:cupin domain-containing protein [Candidatus Cloacimonadota bacterium]